ncbi:MAG: acyl-CoA dehydrogenase family protein [Alphaproteobacteria bacterium]|nr:acyl-CoA dehydrogenase family protein [Alphaproteobacteria bacterium]
MPYDAPISQMRLTLERVGRLHEMKKGGSAPDLDDETVTAILDEANRLARDVLAPLNSIGHREGARLTDEGVIAPQGFRNAYAAFRDGGWMGLAFPHRYGGQDLPKSLALAVMEMIHASNMAFGLCPLLTFGAIEAILAYGTEDQKSAYLPKLISGEWTGAMNLTEPQAGSDVGALRTRATPNEDGTFSLHGQKIYITWGDHDLAENVIQLVLARLPDAPEGSRGVSLFLAPKFLLDENGAPGDRNNFRCIGLEKKMGIHGSPTCVMEYSGAKAWLIGEKNRGLAAMFTMMNSARLNVGLEGVAIAEAARQSAILYASERKQGSATGVEGAAPIIRHPDIRRSIGRITGYVRAARAICYACGAAADRARQAEDPAEREAARLREDLLTPIAKAWSTDRGVAAADINVQIHGGMGFMYDTPAAQLYLDSRIMPIYEGTNGIQAIDLVGRKLAQNNGQGMQDMIREIRTSIAKARQSNDPHLLAACENLEAGTDALEEATDWMIRHMRTDRDAALAGASDYLRLAGDVIGGHFLTVLAMAPFEDSQSSSALATAAFYCGDNLAGVRGRVLAITRASYVVSQMSDSFCGP